MNPQQDPAVWRAARTPKTEAGREMSDALAALAENKPDLVPALRASVLRIEDEASALGGAWQEAAAALPDGWALRIMTCACDEGPGHWRISAGASLANGTDPEVYAEGVPAVALRAVAAAFRER